MFSGLFTDMSDSMGSFIEQFVPDTLRRNAEHDAMQRATDESERRIGQNVLFASHSDNASSDTSLVSGKLVAPLTHFALGMVRHYRGSKAGLDNPVVYTPPHSAAIQHVQRLDLGVYLVNRRLDELYRDNLDLVTDLVDEEYNRPRNGPRRTDIVWSRIQHELGSPTYESESRENSLAACADATCIRYNTTTSPPSSLDPNEWVVYTRRSSPFMTALSTIMGRDTLFNVEKYTLQFVGGTEVRFPTVAFLLGNLDAFVNETTVPSTATLDASEATIITLDTIILDELTDDGDSYIAPVHESGLTMDELEGGKRYTGIRRSFPLPTAVQQQQGKTTMPATVYPRSRTLATTLHMESDWVMLPAWTWSVFKSGRAVGGNDLRTPESICTALSLIEMAILEQSATIDAADTSRLHPLRLAVETLARIVNITGLDAPRVHNKH